jgi:glycosyltransferase involved in cell wall biosynthesis
MPAVSIVVPVYNERENAPGVVNELLAWARAQPAAVLSAFEIVLVDDGSKDDSIAAIEAAIEAAPEVRIVRHARNQGLTAALRTGFSAAALELVTWVPSDGQIPPDAVGDLIAAWHGEAMVISTYHHRPDGIARMILSRGARLFLRVAIGFGDRLEGTYLFQRRLLDEIELVSTRSAGIVAYELAAKVRRRGLSMTTTVITCLPRRSGRSKVADARNIADFLVELVRIRASLRRL